MEKTKPRRGKAREGRERISQIIYVLIATIAVNSENSSGTSVPYLMKAIPPKL